MCPGSIHLTPLPFLQVKLFFFRKPVNKPCYFHSCLSALQKSKSDINLLVTC